MSSSLTQHENEQVLDLFSICLEHGVDMGEAITTLRRNGSFLGRTLSPSQVTHFIESAVEIFGSQISLPSQFTVSPSSPTTTTTTTTTTPSSPTSDQDLYDVIEATSLLSLVQLEDDFTPLALPPAFLEKLPNSARFNTIQSLLNHIDNHQRLLRQRCLTNSSTTTTSTTIADHHSQQQFPFVVSWQQIISDIPPVQEKFSCSLCGEDDFHETPVELFAILRHKLSPLDDARILFDRDCNIINGIELKPCSHKICLDCCIDYITTQLDENPTLFDGGIGNSKNEDGTSTIKKYALPCPCQGIDNDCNFNFSPRLLFALLTPEQCTLYDRRAQGAALGVIEGMKRCPKSGCEYDFIVEGDVPRNCLSNCPKCTSTICLYCLSVITNFQYDHLCGVDHDQENKLSEDVVKQHCHCPKCHIPIFRTVGCDHIKCVKCNHDFCYICKQPHNKGNHDACRTNPYSHLEHL